MNPAMPPWTIVGLRFAAGANRPLVFSLVLRDALLMTVAGIAAGVLLSLSFTRFLARVIRKLPAFDTAAYALASAIVLLLSVSATSIPARQAAGTDPMQVLRGD